MGKDMTSPTRLPELWQWTEFYCPWSYIGTVRLGAIMPEYQGRLKLRVRAFPLELIDGHSAPRHILDQEWWLAAIQEPRAEFAPYTGDDWPTTTMPAFEAAWCAWRLGDQIGLDYDLRVRRAFFAQGRNIGRRDVLVAIAEEAGLDMDRFVRDFESGQARDAVLEEARLGREQFRVPGTPTLMLPNGKRLRHALAYPKMEDDKIVSVSPLSCHGDGCLEATRQLLEQAIDQGEPSQET